MSPEDPARQLETESPLASAVAPGRPRDQNRERAILDAALALVIEVGYDRLTMDAVATRARASKATIYRRWAGKKELIVEAIGCHFEENVAEPKDTGSVRGDLLWLAEQAPANMREVDSRLILGLAQAALSDPGLCVALSEHAGAGKRRAAEIIVERGVARGELPAEADPSLLVEIAPAVLLTRLLNGQGLDHAFLEHLVEDILLPVLSHPPTFPQPLIGDGPGHR
ncbi:MAG: TetR/AcrR family transcriptional regulator [Acidimicrobiaceae bacterium]|nr:TetR/AcrR family transcriptional regulator [Acidimicrobiaceae bacterium]MBO0748645.1 TetR/AcrR family transcriptional regulator [Acidimicrobiaceae bacterium]